MSDAGAGAIFPARLSICRNLRKFNKIPAILVSPHLARWESSVMSASQIRDSALWERVAASDIPACSAVQFVVLGMLPAIAVVLFVGFAAWYAVLSDGAQGLMLAWEAERLQAIEPAAGPLADH